MLCGCSAEKNNILSKTYHNTTAHYNSYFIAREKMKEIEASVEGAHENNFNKILHIFPEPDSTVSAHVKPQIEDCIKKASIAIQRHPNSKWVDDSYVLVGKARYYNLEFTDAIETFKYINAKGRDDDARHAALVYLMRTFIDYKEHNNAIAVSDFLKREKLNKENQKKLYLMRAYLYQQREDYDNMVKNLTLAAPLMSKKEGVARIYFITGQTYQKLGFEAEAYKYYGLCLKSNPTYELSFYSKLNRAQVFELTRNKDLKKIRKYFKKLLKDAKNREFQDKIYYEMGNFERKQDNLDKAIEYYNASIESSQGNRRQKAYSYLKLGEIYYGDEKNYRLAKMYYDSVMMELPKGEENYAQIKEQQEILANFVKQLEIIRVQDSLLMLSRMDTAELSAFLDKVIEERKKRREKEEEERIKKKKALSTSHSSPFDTNQGVGFSANAASTKDWYFYNPSAVGKGLTEFLRLWGRRKLEDHWRRSNRETSTEYSADNIPDASQDFDDIPLTANAQSGKVVLDKSVLFKTVPLTEEAKAKSLAMVEEAYYHLGNIYNFDLQEKQNAIESFNTLLERFPESEHTPEVLYQLYLLHKDHEGDGYEFFANRLVHEYPRSVYAKLISNPNYREENRAAKEQLKKVYRAAYQLYQEEKYDSARVTLKKGLEAHPDNTFADNLRLLEIMVIGKTEGVHQYKFSLANFMEEYKESDLKEYVQSLKKASDEFEKKRVEYYGADYIEDFSQPHSLVLLYPKDAKLSEVLRQKMERFVLENFPDKNINTANLNFDDTFSMILVDKFQDKEMANNFLKVYETENPLKEELQFAKFYNFIINEDNFEILYQYEDYDSYLNFYDRYY